MPSARLGLPRPFVRPVAGILRTDLSRLAGWPGLVAHRPSNGSAAVPQGPRSGPGYVVPVHLHLFDPMCLSSELTEFAFFQAYTQCLCCSGSALAVRQRFRAVTVGSSLTCCPLIPRQARRLSFSHSHCRRRSLRPGRKGSALALRKFRGYRFAFCYDLPRGSPPFRRLLLPGFRRLGHPSPSPGITTVSTV